MYALKRIIAYVIDIVLVMISTNLVTKLFIMTSGTLPFAGTSHGIITVYGSMAISAAIPVVLFGTMIGLFGWTPGKLLLALRVHGQNGKAPGIGQGILREIVKYVGLSFMFIGGLWALYGIITAQRTFYDEWMGLNVDDLKPSGLTETQKRWREFQRGE